MKVLSESQTNELYNQIADFHQKYLESHGVKLSRLRIKGKYTVDALVLVYLTRGYPKTEWVTKTELTGFVRNYRPNINDVQSARHLGMQKGFYIVSSRRGNHYPPDIPPPPAADSYLMISLEKPHPSFKGHREQRQVVMDFDKIKEEYGRRCATCGSREGEPNYRYPNVQTKLQQAHRNPHRPLDPDNTIPQCQLCNRPDRNSWVYDKRGRVVGVASAKVVLKSIKEGWLSEEDIKHLLLYLRKCEETDSSQS